jgi:hypothetical protein
MSMLSTEMILSIETAFHPWTFLPTNIIQMERTLHSFMIMANGQDLIVVRKQHISSVYITFLYILCNVYCHIPVLPRNLLLCSNYDLYVTSSITPLHEGVLSSTPDGWFWAQAPDGWFWAQVKVKVNSFGPDGRLVVLYSDSWLVLLYSDGRLVVLYSDSRLVVLYSDSRLVVLYSDSRFWVRTGLIARP